MSFDVSVAADLEAYLGWAYRHLDAGGAVLDQAIELVHGLARDDDARHAFGAFR